MMRSFASAETLPLPRRFATSASLSPSVSGSSRTVVAFTFPPPHVGRASSRSGRLSAITMIGTSFDQSAT